MRRKSLALAGIIGLLFVLAGPSVAHAGAETCAGVVAITDTSPPDVSASVAATIIRFDFTGVSDICLSDGRKVTGALAGHTIQVVGADGAGTIVVRETLTIADGSTLGYVAVARFSSSGFQGNIFTTTGTGQLARVVGRGTFFPTGPTTFASFVTYEYL